jgi:hypothetical protein
MLTEMLTEMATKAIIERVIMLSLHRFGMPKRLKRSEAGDLLEVMPKTA